MGIIKLKIYILMALILLFSVNAAYYNSFNDSTTESNISLNYINSFKLDGLTKYKFIKIPLMGYIDVTNYFYLQDSQGLAADWFKYDYTDELYVNNDLWTNYTKTTGGATASIIATGEYYELNYTNDNQPDIKVFLTGNNTLSYNFNESFDLLINFTCTFNISIGGAANTCGIRFINTSNNIGVNVVNTQYTGVVNVTNSRLIRLTRNASSSTILKYEPFDSLTPAADWDFSFYDNISIRFQAFSEGATASVSMKVYAMGFKTPVNDSFYIHNTTNPENLTVTLGDNLIYNNPGNFTGSIKLNFTNELEYNFNNGSCNCSACVLSDFCYIPVNFTSYNGGSIYLYDLNYNINITAITINIFDQLTGSIINTKQVDLKAVQNDLIFNYSTTDGTFNLDLETTGAWTLEFNTSNYTRSVYQLNILGNETYTLNVFMLPNVNNYQTTFTFLDSDLGDILQGAQLTAYRVINNSWEIVNILTSDVTGRVLFDYNQNDNYKFIIILDDYETKTFYLNPISYNSYNVWLNKVYALDDPNLLQSVYLDISPRELYADNLNEINITILNPDLLLTEYTASADYDIYNDDYTGVYPAGELFQLVLNTSGAQFGDVATIQINYNLSDNSFNYITHLNIITNGTTGNSIFNLKNNSYGLTLFEKTLIAVIIIVVVSGVFGYLIGGSVSLLIGMVLTGLFSYLNFINRWAGLVSILLLFLALAFKGWE